MSHQGLQCLCTSARFAFVPMHVEMVTVITMFIQKILAGRNREMTDWVNETIRKAKEEHTKKAGAKPE